MGLTNVSITLWSYKYFQDRFKFNHSNISLAVWFGNFFSSLVLQIFPWHFILQIFTGKFDHQIISKIVYCTNVSRTFWSYNCFKDILILQLFPGHFGSTTNKCLQDSLDTCVWDINRQCLNWKHQDWGIKLENPMVYKLEASRLGHKTGKTHGLQIGSIKIGA